MLNRFFGNNFHTYLHIFGLCAVAAGVPFNKIMMSLAMMLIVLNLFLEGDFKQYFQNLKTNKLYLFVLGFFLLHIIALLWTSNFDYALHDLKVKLPLLVIPTVIAAKPIEETKYINLILGSILISTMVLSLINFFSYQAFFSGETHFDFREMSLFTSHIRFGIIISMVVGIAIHFIRKSTGNQLVFVLVIFWLTFYTFYSQVISGWLSLLLVFLIYTIYGLWRKYKWIVLTSIGILTVLFILLLSWLFAPVVINKDDYKSIEKYTIEGNKYSHVFGVVDPATKKPVHLYVCAKELKREWPKRSNFPIDSLDSKGQSIFETLIRYLASKNVKKDALGLSELNQDEIIRIENGVTSVLRNGVMERLYGLKYQLINKSNPNNHSLLQRLEYWKTAVEIAKQNVIIGVGTGDVQDAFNSQYDLNKSVLHPDKRRRAHNYYLTVQITFGIVGLIYFLVLLFNFVQFNYIENQMVGVIFILIIIISFFLEDTIETQTGITFFGLFYGLFSFKQPPKNDDNKVIS